MGKEGVEGDCVVRGLEVGSRMIYLGESKCFYMIVWSGVDV